MTFDNMSGNLKRKYGNKKKIPKIRRATESEESFFKKNPTVAGMAASDDNVVLNPYSKLKPKEQLSVFRNEFSRIIMRQDKKNRPDFKLTNEQKTNLKGTHYENASQQDRTETIAARQYSGDPSGGTPTDEQKKYTDKLRKRIIKRYKGSK